MQQAEQTNIIAGPWKRRRRRRNTPAPEGGQVVLRAVEHGVLPDGRPVTYCVIVSNIVPLDSAL